MNGKLDEFIRHQMQVQQNSSLPLKDIRVVEAATVLAGPFAGTLLADYGAEVIKVENPGLPDSTRGWGVLEDGTQPWWLVMNRNKFPVTLNLKAPDGVKAFADLIAKSDVLIENMKVGALDRLGFSKQRLLELNKGLVIARVTGYGQTGPFAQRPGFGTVAEGFSGFTYVNGEPGKPISSPLPLADTYAGLHMAFAIMIALRNAKRGVSGGSEIDISLYEPLLGLLGADVLDYSMTGRIPMPMGSELSFTVPRNNYQTKDGRWIGLSASAQTPFETLMTAIGKPEMNTDPRYKTNEARIKPENRSELNRVIAEFFIKMTSHEAIETCERLGVTAGLVANMSDVVANQHIKERGSIVDVRDYDGRVYRMPDVAIRIPGSPGAIRFPGLPLGSANDVIYGDVLGYTPGQIQKMRDSKAI